jgi:hypothetical protein
MARVDGLGGIRDQDGQRSSHPRLPRRMKRLSFKVHVSSISSGAGGLLRPGCNLGHRFGTYLLPLFFKVAQVVK